MAPVLGPRRGVDTSRSPGQTNSLAPSPKRLPLATSTAIPTWVNAGRAWGMFFLAAVFGVGSFFLFRRSLEDWHNVLEKGTAGGVLLGVLYAVLALIGLVKGEI